MSAAPGPDAGAGGSAGSAALGADAGAGGAAGAAGPDEGAGGAAGAAGPDEGAGGAAGAAGPDAGAAGAVGPDTGGARAAGPHPGVAEGVGSVATAVRAAGAVEAWLHRHADELVAIRRDLHAHPELGHAEHRTTQVLVERLSAAGLAPKVLQAGTGVACDLGTGGPPFVALRADIDALPLQDEKRVPYRSTVDGVCHACGHDVHTTAVLGAGLALAGAELPGTVRLLFQPAEEMMPGGALDVLREGWLEGVSSVFALHCDPTLEVGRVGLKAGPITAAADALRVELTGPGGHTSRPHNTVDLVHALAIVATGLPEALGRLVDPRAGMCVVWGHVSSGLAANAIPRSGLLRGTVRVLDKAAWEDAPGLVQRIVEGLVAPYGAHADVRYERGVPPVVNDPHATAVLANAVDDALGPAAAVPTLQSLGGEDFAWYLEQVPGSMARLGVKPPGLERPYDLHQGAFDVDEGALPVAVRVLVAAALAGLSSAA